MRNFFAVLAMLGLISLLPAQVNAQSLSQSSGGELLQQQSGRAQATDNSQNKTGSPQSGGNQSALNTPSAQQPLGVVSDPRQNRPDAIAQPNTDLVNKADSTSKKTSWTYYKLLAGFLALFATTFFVAYRFSKLDNFSDANSEEEPIHRNQLAVTLGNQRPSKSNKPKKKRRKPHQR